MLAFFDPYYALPRIQLVNFPFLPFYGHCGVQKIS